MDEEEIIDIEVEEEEERQPLVLLETNKIPAPLLSRAISRGWGPAKLANAIKGAFVEYYTGNLKQTIKLMKDDGWDNLPTRKAMQQWLWEDVTQEQIARRMEDESLDKKYGIAVRRELQVWWTELIRDEEETKDEEGYVAPRTNLATKMRAAENLAKSHGLFIEKKVITGELSLASLLAEKGKG